MKTKLLFSLFLFIIVSCNKPEESNYEIIPSCIQEKIDQSGTILNVSIQKVNGEYFYMFDHRSFIVYRFIYNSECEEVCTNENNESIPLECLEDFKSDAWEIIWEQ